MNNLWDYSKRGKDLSASNLAAAQKRMEQKKYDEENQFNPINAAIAAAAAYFTGGASLTWQSAATAAAAAATAPRGNVKPLEAGLSGYTKQMGVQNVGNLIKDGGAQALIQPENVGKVTGAVQAWQNKPEEAMKTMSQPKQLSDFDKFMLSVYSTVISDPKSTPEAKSEAAKASAKLYGKEAKASNITGQQPAPQQMVTNFPQGTVQAFQDTVKRQGIDNIVPQYTQPAQSAPMAQTSQPEGEMFPSTLFAQTTDELEKINKKKSELGLQTEEQQLEGIKTEKGLGSLHAELKSKIIDAVKSKDMERLIRIKDIAQKELTGSKKYQDDILNRVQTAIENHNKLQEKTRRSEDQKAERRVKEQKKNANLPGSDAWKALKQPQKEALSSIETTARQFDMLKSKMNNLPESLIGRSTAALTPAPMKSGQQKDFESDMNLLYANISSNFAGNKGVLSDQDLAFVKDSLPSVNDKYRDKVKKYNDIVQLINNKIDVFMKVNGLTESDIPFRLKRPQKISLTVKSYIDGKDNSSSIDKSSDETLRAKIEEIRRKGKG